MEEFPGDDNDKDYLLGEIEDLKETSFINYFFSKIYFVKKYIQCRIYTVNVSHVFGIIFGWYTYGPIALFVR